ncbi:MAG: type II toxin-antitoxin system VapC family toxin [Pseudomonadota bacterium]|jgi:predicted nucleic acid-binding protein
MSLVLDASVALAWCFQDETSALAERALDELVVSGGVVPGLWRLEVANALKMAVRRGRMTLAQRDQALADLADLAVAVDVETDTQAWTATLTLADRFNLTLYDAAYLELAQRRNLPLASLDTALCNASQTLGLLFEG